MFSRAVFSTTLQANKTKKLIRVTTVCLYEERCIGVTYAQRDLTVVSATSKSAIIVTIQKQEDAMMRMDELTCSQLNFEE